MAEITFYFLRGRNWISGTIARGQMGFPYTHVGCRLASGHLISAHWQDGVQIRKDSDEGGWTNWAWISIPCTDDEYEKHEDWLLAQVEKRYDIGAILGMAARFLTAISAPSHWPTRWVCSSLQYQGLKELGRFPRIEPAPISTVTPRDFMFSLMGIEGRKYSIREVGR